MSIKKSNLLLVCLLLWGAFQFSYVHGTNKECQKSREAAASFVEFQSLDLEQQPPTPVTVKGKLKLPVKFNKKEECFLPEKQLRAVVILHGSAGVDFRGDFYARALNASGIATFEIDMWEARGVKTGNDRPALPFVYLPGCIWRSQISFTAPKY